MISFYSIILPVGIVAGILLVCLGYYFLKLFPQTSQVSENQNSNQVIFWIYSILNIVAAFTWFSVLIEILPLPIRIPLFDYGAIITGLLLLVLIPLGLLSIHLIGRRSIGGIALVFRRYVLFSKIFLVISLIPGILAIIFYLLLAMSNR